MSRDVTGCYRPVAVTVRSGHDESVHHGAVVGLAADGSVGLQVGNPTVPVYPRSAMKPLQATAMVDAGLDLPGELLALVCASHDGRREHLDGVRRILGTVGLDESALANTPDLPLDPDTAEQVLRAGGARTALAQNCSGKHAGMLATCVVNGWPTDASYLDPGHPLQRRITAALPGWAGEAPAHVGVDGCGAPAHVLTLLGLARAVRALLTGAAGPAGDRVVDAMRRFPDLVGGPARDVSLLMRAVPGLVAKDGAEGVFVAGMADGRVVALKVADGAGRARPPVMVAALAQLGIDVGAVPPPARRSVVLGHGRPVGEVRSLL